MMANAGPSVAVLKSWRQIYQTDNLLRQCQDEICGGYGLTVEQYAVLIVLNYAGGSARITDIARWLIRSTNSITMIVDRMVKAGLVKRTRDRVDRRVVNVTPTSRAENSFKLAIPAGWEFIHKIMLPLSEADRHTLARLLETIRYEALNYLNPREDIQAMVVNDDKSHIKMMERLFHDALLSTPQAKHQSGKRKP